MKKLIVLLIVSFLLSLHACISVVNSSAKAGILGKYPVCEPSAVVKITCPDSQANCLLVGDNEVKNSLFLYSLNSEKLNSDSQRELSADNLEISDIEAITSLDKDTVLILGSHSRNSQCEIKKNRQRVAKVRILSYRLEPTSEVLQTSKIESKILFDSIDIAKNKILQAVSNRINAAEQAADLAKGNKKACQKANAFNAEGVVAIPSKASVSTVWIGLRSPLVSIKQKNFAILLRMKSLDKSQFDQVALLDLEGRGIRELTLAGNTIWGIAGGPEDGKNNFIFWKFPVSSLKPSAFIKPEIYRSLPPSSEGLAIWDSKMYVLIDGERGESNSRCQIPGKFIEFAIK